MLRGLSFSVKHRALVLCASSPEGRLKLLFLIFGGSHLALCLKLIPGGIRGPQESHEIPEIKPRSVVCASPLYYHLCTILQPQD